MIGPRRVATRSFSQAHGHAWDRSTGGEDPYYGVKEFEKDFNENRYDN